MKKSFSIIIGIILSFGLISRAFAVMPDGWTYDQSGEGYQFELSHERDEVYEGRASLHILYDGMLENNKYIYIHCQQAELSSKSEYRLSFYAKAAEGNICYWKWMWDWTQINLSSSQNSDWTYFSYDFTPDKDGSYLGMIVDSMCDYYIDNIELYKLDENKMPIGGNLITNGDFENGDFTPTADVSDVDSEPIDSGVILSWTNPDDADFDRVEIYSIDEYENEELLVTVDPEEEKRSSVQIDNLKNGEIRYFKIYAIDIAGNKSSGVKTFADPRVDDYYTGEIITFLTGEEDIRTDELLPGVIKAKTFIQNNTQSSGIDGVLIAALYSNNQLVDIKTDQKSVPLGDSVDFEVSVNIPDGNEYELDIYLWDENYNMLGTSKILH